jgi:hypothetical protein
MKIGVFGDSFADKNQQSRIWWQYLKNTYHHDVECFGECASSILFSAQKIEKLGENFDLVIWALTSPNRISVENQGIHYHVNSVDNYYDGKDLYVERQFQAAHDYLTYLYHEQDGVLIGKTLVYFLQQHLKNILILPCFPPPLSSKFNLYNLCEWETKFYFPNMDIPKIYADYQDLRPGHLTDANQQILAKLLNDNLVPGIFQTEYDHFIPPLEPFKNCFTKF